MTATSPPYSTYSLVEPIGLRLWRIPCPRKFSIGYDTFPHTGLEPMESAIHDQSADLWLTNKVIVGMGDIPGSPELGEWQ